jgi:hypothetical protein
MDRERAETHLRLLAERALRALARSAEARPAEAGPAEAGPAEAGQGAVVTVNMVAHALVTVGALDPATGALIVDELALALDSRQPVPPAPGRGPRPRRWWPVSYGSDARPAPRPRRIVAAGHTMPIPDGSVHVLAYARSGSGGAFAVIAHLAKADPLNGLTATDDTGASYQLTFSGGGWSGEWAGELALHPDPPPGLRWLEIAGPGTPGQRVDISAEPEPDRVAAPVPASPGEYLLNFNAAYLLAAVLPFSPEERRAMAATPSVHASLGEIVTGLVVAGALAPDSPVPAQLAALREAVGIDGPGRTTAPGQELPEHWAGVLASHRPAGPDAEQPDGCAGAALTLPELDGVVVSVLGLHNAADGTSTLFVHASGVPPWLFRGGAEVLPLIWLRDSDDRWHVTRANGGSAKGNGELTMRLAVIPPLTRSDWIEVLMTGRTAQVRATAPLRWG